MKIDRNKVYEKHHAHCGYCGDIMKMKDMQVDHIIPKAFFSSHIKYGFKIPTFLQHLTEADVDHFDNLMPTCRKCNTFKSAESLEVFRSELSHQLERANRYSANYRMAKKFGQVEERPKPIVFYFESDDSENKLTELWRDINDG